MTEAARTEAELGNLHGTPAVLIEEDEGFYCVAFYGTLLPESRKGE